MKRFISILAILPLLLGGMFVVQGAVFAAGGECMCRRDGGNPTVIRQLSSESLCHEQDEENAEGTATIGHLSACTWIPGDCWCEVQNTNPNTSQEPTQKVPDFALPEQCVSQGVYQNCHWIRVQQNPPASPNGNTEPVFNQELTTKIDELDQFNGKSLPKVIGTMVQVGMGLIGAVALVIFIYGGIIWMLARGNATEQEKAFNTILWAGLGVAVIFASYALVDYVFEAFR